MIKFTANIRSARAETDDTITTSSVGIPVSLNLASDFDGLAKTVVFKAGAAAVDVALVGDANSTTVPPDVLTEKGKYLSIGIYAADGEENIVIPTVWATVGMIHEGAVPSGIDPAAPTPSWAAQVQEIANEALETAQSVREDADNGAFDGAQGPKGDPGEVTQAEFDELKSAISESTYNLNTAAVGQYSIDNSGVITTGTSKNFGMAEKVSCEESTQYTVTCFNVSYSKAAYYAAFYETDGTFISRATVNNKTNYKETFTSPANSAFICFCFYAPDGASTSSDSRIQIEKGAISHPYIPPESANDVVARASVANVESSLSGNIEVSLASGYYTANGTIGAASSDKGEKYTNKINAQLYTKIDYGLHYTSSVAVWAALSSWSEDGTFSRTTLLNATGADFDGSVEITPAMKYVAFSFRSYNETPFEIVGTTNTNTIAKEITKIDQVDRNQNQSAVAANVNRFKPFYDHLFIDKINGVNVVIPSESLFNIQISHRLGFDMIEANVHSTSDNHFIVMHGQSGKFGQQVEHVDGVTDISQTAINSVTLSWIQTNVRYKSLYQKYRVSPPTLEAFLFECRKNCMIPMVTASDKNALDIIDGIMGKGNYVAYNGTRENTPAPITTFPSLATKEEILALCESYGIPYMYCMANPTDFTDAELAEIVGLLHSKGYLIGFAGSYTTELESQRLLSLGFDFSASKYQINDFASGNICNLSADVDYTDFTTTGTVANNLLTLAAGETVIPGEAIPAVFLGGASLHIRFVGSLTVKMGTYINTTVTSDGTQTMWFSTYVLQSAPDFLLTATDTTQILNLDFKASKM